MALQAASAYLLEVAAGSASGRIWAEVAGIRRGMPSADVRRIEISDLQNREGQHPSSAGPRGGYRRDWLVVWRLERARAHGRTRQRRSHRHADTRAQGGDFSFSTFGKTMPFFGNILPTLRSYSRIEQCTLSVTAPALASEPSLDHKAIPL
jgi:hypothetical protein